VQAISDLQEFERVYQASTSGKGSASTCCGDDGALVLSPASAPSAHGHSTSFPEPVFADSASAGVR